MSFAPSLNNPFRYRIDKMLLMNANADVNTKTDTLILASLGSEEKNDKYPRPIPNKIVIRLIAGPAAI